MADYWLYKRWDTRAWDVYENDKWADLPSIVPGSLHIIEAENRAEALITEIDASELIQRVLDDVEKMGITATYQKWLTANATVIKVEINRNRQLIDYL